MLVPGVKVTVNRREAPWCRCALLFSSVLLCYILFCPVPLPLTTTSYIQADNAETGPARGGEQKGRWRKMRGVGEAPRCCKLRWTTCCWRGNTARANGLMFDSPSEIETAVRRGARGLGRRCATGRQAALTRGMFSRRFEAQETGLVSFPASLLYLYCKPGTWSDRTKPVNAQCTPCRRPSPVRSSSQPARVGSTLNITCSEVHLKYPPVPSHGSCPVLSCPVNLHCHGTLASIYAIPLMCLTSAAPLPFCLPPQPTYLLSCIYGHATMSRSRPS